MARRTASEELIFSRNRWEIAHTEGNSTTGRVQWVRRDTSYICDVGDELARQPLPAPPSRS